MPRAPELATGPVERDELGDLVVRCAHGDRVAFAALYDAVAGRAYGLTVRILRDRGLAEEATREAFSDIWSSAGRFDPRQGTGLRWILTITHRKAVDHVRSGRSPQWQGRSREPSNAAGLDVTGDGSPHVDAERGRAAWRGLTPLQREAIELAYFDALVHADVAAALGIPVGGAHAPIRSGLHRLRAAWVPPAP